MKKYKPSIFALLFLIASSAFAANSTTSMNVSSTLNSSCSMMVFGFTLGTMTPASSGNLVSGVTTNNGEIDTTCTKTTPYTLSIDSGSGTISARTMIGSISSNHDKLS